MGLKEKNAMTTLGRICSLCDVTVWPDDVFDHYAVQHPGEEWDLANWPDGTVAFIEDSPQTGRWG